MGLTCLLGDLSPFFTKYTRPPAQKMAMKRMTLEFRLIFSRKFDFSRIDPTHPNLKIQTWKCLKSQQLFGFTEQPFCRTFSTCASCWCYSHTLNIRSVWFSSINWSEVHLGPSPPIHPPPPRPPPSTPRDFLGISRFPTGDGAEQAGYKERWIEAHAYACANNRQ